jgi:hypothetical protein
MGRAGCETMVERGGRFRENGRCDFKLMEEEEEEEQEQEEAEEQEEWGGGGGRRRRRRRRGRKHVWAFSKKWKAKRPEPPETQPDIGSNFEAFCTYLEPFLGHTFAFRFGVTSKI